MSPPNSIGGSKRKAKGRGKGKAFVRCHRAAALQVTISIPLLVEAESLTDAPVGRGAR
jgi:hypothetical protein